MRKEGFRPYLVVGLLLILLASFMLDGAAALAITAIKNPFLDYVIGWFSHLGSLFVVLIFMASLFLWEERKREWIPVLLASFAASLAISYLLKFVFLRPRPGSVEKFVLNIPDYSFPSTHASISFSCVPVLDREFPMLKWFWVCFAGLVSFSRLYLGVHHLSDVVGGIILGLALGELAVFIEERYGIFKRLRARI